VDRDLGRQSEAKTWDFEAFEVRVVITSHN